MKRKGLSWDGGKKRLIAAMVLAAVMVLPGIAHARTAPTSTTSTETTTTSTTTTRTNLSVRGVSWS